MSMDARAAIEAAEAAAKSAGGGIVDRLAARLGARPQAEAVFAAPVERNGVTIVPVARVRTGFGGGNGPTGTGEGGGGGLSASPLGYIEITEGRAEFRPIFDPGAYAGLVVAAGLSAWLTLRGLKALFR
ncbi:MAG TPA: spore germination protein GerW family protein [Tepidiformaceae bacterium]